MDCCKKPQYNKEKHRSGRRDRQRGSTQNTSSRASSAESSTSRTRSEGTVRDRSGSVKITRNPLPVIDESDGVNGYGSEEETACSTKSIDDDESFSEAEPDINANASAGGVVQNVCIPEPGWNSSPMTSTDINGNLTMFTDNNGNSMVLADPNTIMSIDNGNPTIASGFSDNPTSNEVPEFLAIPESGSDSAPPSSRGSRTSLSRLGSSFSVETLSRPKPEGYFLNSVSEQFIVNDESSLTRTNEAEQNIVGGQDDPEEVLDAGGDALFDDDLAVPVPMEEDIIDDDDNNYNIIEIQRPTVAEILGLNLRTAGSDEAFSALLGQDEAFPVLVQAQVARNFPFLETYDEVALISPNSEAEREYILRTSAVDLQKLRELQPATSCTQLFNNSKPTVLEMIVSYLEFPDLLAARQVCKLWFKSITNADGFWNIVCVVKIRNLRVNWENLIRSDLVNEFSCPNYHLFRCNLVDLHANCFIMRTVSHMKHLTLTECSFSLATLQLILSECMLLEHLEIIGLPTCISFSEALYPVRPGAHRFPNLQTIIIKATKPKKRNGKCLPDPWHDDRTYVNLHKEFIADLLCNSTALRKVKMDGFGSVTCFHVITNFAVRNRRHSQLEELHFQGIPHDRLNFDHFFPLATNSLNLRKFSLSLRDPLPQEEPNFYDHKAFVNLIVHEIIKLNRNTLNDLTLDNVPLNVSIFSQPMPRVVRISTIGTGVYLRGSDHTSFLPMLERIAELNDPAGPHPGVNAFPNEILEQSDYPMIEDEDINPSFSLNVVIGKLMMAIFSGIFIFGVFHKINSGIPSETLASMIFVYVVVAVIALCASN